MRTWMWPALAAAVITTNLAPAAEPWNLPQLRGSPQGFARNAAWRQEAATPAPARPPAPMPAVTGHSGIGVGSSHSAIGSGVASGSVISQTAWNNEHIYTGYVFGPGSCDHTPPCIDHLWDGYCQRPRRCGHHHGLFHHHGGGCGQSAGCATCGDNVATCDTGCHGFRLHGFRRHGCGMSCSTCDTCSDACGCGGGFGKHFRAKCSGWFNNLCNACDGGMSCGCAAPIGNGNGLESLPAPEADSPAPTPAPDEANSARRNLINRYVPWSLK
jgi:hypothetical protein